MFLRPPEAGHVDAALAGRSLRARSEGQPREVSIARCTRRWTFITRPWLATIARTATPARLRLTPSRRRLATACLVARFCRAEHRELQWSRLRRSGFQVDVVQSLSPPAARRMLTSEAAPQTREAGAEMVLARTSITGRAPGGHRRLELLRKLDACAWILTVHDV